MRSVAFYIKGKTKNTFDYNGKKLLRYEVRVNTGVLLCLEANNNAADNEIVAFKPNGKKKADFVFNGAVGSVSISGNRVYLLSDKLYSFKYNGKLASTLDINAGALSVSAYKSGAAVLYSSTLNYYK